MDLGYLPWISISIGISGMVYMTYITLISSTEDSPLKKSTNGVFFLIFSLLICLPVTYLLTPISVNVDPNVVKRLMASHKPESPSGGPSTGPVTGAGNPPDSDEDCPGERDPFVVSSGDDWKLKEAMKEARADAIAKARAEANPAPKQPIGEERLQREAMDSMKECKDHRHEPKVQSSAGYLTYESAIPVIPIRS